MEAYTIQINTYGTRRYLNADNQLHRTDSPAVEYPDGTREWYLNDVNLSETEFLK